MNQNNFKIENIPAILLGEPSEKVFLYIHGKCGSKEEAIGFAEIVCPNGWQVLGIDLPQHGERKEESIELLPWNVVPELTSVMQYLKSNWNHISLRANSIGAWFSMLSFSNEKIGNCLFVSPILDMELLIKNLMQWANVTEKQLEEQKEIDTGFGETLYWDYYNYVKEHSITCWNNPTHILYAGKDNLTSRDTVVKFSKRFSCNLSVMENGEHWFHTDEQIMFMNRWIKQVLGIDIV